MNRTRPWILTALFASGVAGLMHEVVWAKLLATMIGSTSAAQAVVLAVFMGGLAIGALIFGRRSDAKERPARLYVVLEILIAAYGVALPWIARGAATLYESLLADAFDSPAVKLGARLLVASLVIAFPAICMGGTLPVLARALVRHVSQTRQAVALLYAINNIGAVVGTGIAGFFLLPAFGIYASLGAASALNLVAAALAWLAPRPEPDEAPAALESDVGIGGRAQRGVDAERADGERYSGAAYRATLVALLLAGFAAMGYEVLYLRVIALGLGASSYAFTLMLMAFITGIGAGSFLTSVLRVRRPLWWFAASQLGVVVAMLGSTVLAERLPYYVGLARVGLQEHSSGYALFLASQGAIVLAILLVPTVLLGMGFPLVAQIQARGPRSIGANVGTTYAWNTLGNVLGTVITSLVLLPRLGLEHAFHVQIALELAAALLLVAVAREASPRWRAAGVGMCAAAVALYAIATPTWSSTLNLATGHVRLREGPAAQATETQLREHPTSSFASWRDYYVVDPADWDEVFVHEGADSTVVAVRKDRLSELFINGKGDASSDLLDMVTQTMLAHVPMFANLEARSVLVIGYGAGVTTGSVIQHPVEQVDVVEISEGVLQADRLFSQVNRSARASEKVRVYREDARTFLRTAPKQYDVIISEPSNPWVAGVSNLFTRDFFEDAAARLAPDGVFCLWFHAYEQSNPAVELVLRTLHSVYPHAQLFHTDASGDVIVVASRAPIEPDFAGMELRYDLPEVRRDLTRVLVYNLATLLSYHAIADSRWPRMFGEGPVNTDDHQRLEYVAVRNLFLGNDSDLVARFDGYVRSLDGETDCWLDRYRQWRTQQGVPCGRQELETAARALSTTFSSGDVLTGNVILLQTRLGAADPNVPVGATAARGGIPPLGELDYVEAFNRGSEREAAGDWERARAFFERALEVQPGHPMPLAKLVLRAVGEGDSERALALVAAGRASRPDDLDLKLFSGRLLFQLEKHEQARALYEEICARTENAEALCNLAGYYEQDQAFDKAIGLYERARVVDPNAWQPAYRLVLLYARDPTQQASIERSLFHLKDSLERNPDHPELVALARQLAGQ